MKKLKEQKPSLQGVIDKGLLNNPIYISETMRMEGTEEEGCIQTRSCTFLTSIDLRDTDSTQEEEDGLMETLGTFQQLKEMVLKEQVKEIAVATTELEVTKIRKILEYIFNKVDIQLTLLVTSQQYEEMCQRRGAWETQAKKRRVNKRTIEVSPNINEGGTYATILRKMKQNIDVDSMGIKINKIQKTAKGKMRIAISETKNGAATEFANKTKTSLGNSATVLETKERRRTIVIRDIDIDVGKEEIKQAIANNITANDKEIIIHTLKETRMGSSQVATASVPSESLKGILEKRGIRIGWTRCGIYELITPKKCYKCQKHGHIAKECKNSELAMKDRCNNCTEYGHTMRECQKEAYCIDCEQHGHPSATMNCKIYRDLVKQEKKIARGTNKEAPAMQQNRERKAPTGNN